MTMGVPSPPGGGGGEGGGISNSPPYSVPGLKLTIPVLTNGAVYTSLMEADTNSAYDLFEQFALSTNGNWARIATGQIGETNFAVTQLSSTNAFYRAADTTDSDFDGLSDAYEKWVTHTNPLSPDSDNDGLPDGSEDFNGNGIPDRFDYRRLDRAVIFASRTTAYEGGQTGELTILLPTPAPTNGTVLTLHLGGYTDYGFDYTLTNTTGIAVTNEVVFAAGQTQAKINVNAVNDATQQTRLRTVQVTLTSSVNYLLDPELAQVTLVDNDLPLVSIIALDPRAAEASGYGTNTGTFLIRREGSTDGPLSVHFQIGGTASHETDYVLRRPDENPTQPVDARLLQSGSNTLVLPVTPLPDSSYEGDETVTISLVADEFFVVDTNAASATVTIADCDEPPVVSFEGTDLLATEYNLKSATVTLRRVGCALGPMQVPLAISGTASNGVDYRLMTNNVVVSNSVVAFAAGAGTVTLNVVPLGDSLEEQVERVVLTLKGSLAYTIGSSNSVTVLLDDASTTRYQVVPVKRPAVLSASPSISSPALYELWRFGRSSSSAAVPFTVGNNPSGVSIAKSGNVDASDNFVLAPYATRAQLRLLPGASNLTNYQNYFFTLNVPSVTTTSYPFNIRPPWEYGQFQVTATNAIEGAMTNARVQFSRLVAGAPISLTVVVSGSANHSGQSSADHNQPATFTLSLSTNATSVETNITATADSLAEGWEGIAFTPDLLQLSPCVDPHAPYFAFVGDNVANPNLLPGGDADGDGLSDRWEIDHGLDPLDQTDAQIDPDKDGLTNLDEYQANTDPQDDDTDDDGQKDFKQRYRPEPGPDYLAIRLRTLDTGKVNNGANCAVCHTTRLKVGDYSLYSAAHGHAIEQTFSFRKGNSYPIWLQEISRNHLPTTNTGNTPQTTAQYNAELLPATDALPAAFVVQDPNTKLGTNQDWTSFPADPTVPVGTLIVPKIEVIWEDVLDSGVLETNPAVGGGYRFYPDQQSPTDTTDRRRLFVRVKTVPPLPGQQVRLRSLDVDDPTPVADDPFLIIDNTDGFGFESGDDNRGTPKPGNLQDTVLTLDVLGEGVTFFTVTMQPGDNFRVAAVLDTPGAANHLNALQVSMPFSQMYVAASDAPALGFVGALSPMLTVWRKLHLEFDSMAAPPSSGPESMFDSVTIVSIEPNRPTNGNSRLRLLHPAGVQGNNLYEFGKLDIPTVGLFRITDSWTELADGARAYTTTRIDGVPATNVFNFGAKLFDDDDRYLTNDPPLYPSLLNLPPPLPIGDVHLSNIIPLLQSAFRPAYIEVINANPMGWNGAQTIPFRRNEAAIQTFLGVISSYFDQGNLDFKGKDRPEFWTHSVVYGYQPSRSEDGDPDGESALEGGTPKWRFIDPHPMNQALGFSVVFMESVRDVAIERNPGGVFTNSSPASLTDLRLRYWSRLAGQTAHEVGHAPGRQGESGDHAEEHLMKSGGDSYPGPDANVLQKFAPATIRRFRGTPQWNN